MGPGGNRVSFLMFKDFEWIISLREVVMEDTEGRRQSPLALIREFVGCRLENQVLIRAYELAVPADRLMVSMQQYGTGERVTQNEEQVRAVRIGA